MGIVDPTLGYHTISPALVSGQPVWISDPTQPAGEALNPAAFTLPAGGVSNAALRNAIPSPYGISQGDFALRRRFNLTDRVKLDFRIEYFNIFNHPMFGGPEAPYAWLGDCSGNTPASCAAPNFRPNTLFGKVFVGNGVSTVSGETLNVGLGTQSQQYAPGGPRSGQVTLKLSF